MCPLLMIQGERQPIETQRPYLRLEAFFAVAIIAPYHHETELVRFRQ